MYFRARASSASSQPKGLGGGVRDQVEGGATRGQLLAALYAGVTPDSQLVLHCSLASRSTALAASDLVPLVTDSASLAGVFPGPTHPRPNVARSVDHAWGVR
eukprot:885186-Prorocentrum_minimum.AAC.2